MRKILSLLMVLFAATSLLFAKQGGTLSSNPAAPIDPTKTVTLTYNGSQTDFANWQEELKCYIHAWLEPAQGQAFSKDYTTAWADCNSNEDYAKLDSKLKMNAYHYSYPKGMFSINMNIKSFFNVADEDLPKIGRLGVIVRAQYKGDDNLTEDMFLNVALSDESYPKDSVYFVNIFGWTNPKVHLWTGEGEQAKGTAWPGVEMVKLDEKINECDVYKVVIKAGQYTHCIFNDGQETGGKQTPDLDWTSRKYYYGDQWYDETAIPDAPDANAIYSVGGNSRALFYNEWDPYHIQGYTKMTRVPGSWLYTWDRSEDEIALYAAPISFKIYMNKNKNLCWPEGDNCATLNIDEWGMYQVLFTFNAVTKEITAEATRVGDITLFNFELMGIDGDWSVGKPFEFDEDKAVSLVRVKLEAGDYTFKLRDQDHPVDWYGEELEFTRDDPKHGDVKKSDSEKNMTLHADVDGEYIFIYNFDLKKLLIAFPAQVPAKRIAALDGVFSVNSTAKVNFSRGNLHYNFGEDAWYAALKQYDIAGYSNLRFGDPAYKGSIDIFSWSCTTSPYGLLLSNKDADYNGDFVEWGDKFADTNEGWRTLTSAEWNYILYSRGNKAWTFLNLGPDSINGLALFPDNWNDLDGISIKYKFYDFDNDADYQGNNVSLEDWTKLEAAGVVFLPLVGSRAGFVGNNIGGDGVSVTSSVNPLTGSYCWMSGINDIGYYWFSTQDPNAGRENMAYSTMLPGTTSDWMHYAAPNNGSREKRRGNAVRLVAPAKEPAKYYITGNEALTGEHMAWDVKAIKATEDTTILHLEAGSYQLKVLFQGEWKGYDQLTEKEITGLSKDDDDNICFTLKQAGDVMVVYKSGAFAVKGNFDVATGCENLMSETKVTTILRNGTIYILRGDKTYTVQGQLVR